jgi:hypothetical protein
MCRDRGAAISILRGIEIASVASLPRNDTRQLRCYKPLATLLGISATSGLILSYAMAATISLVWSIYELITAKNERERLAAGVALIFTLGFVAFGAYRFSKIPCMPNNASSTRTLPNSKSALGEFFSKTAALLRGERVVARQVTIKTHNNIRVRVDLIVRTLRGKLKLTDAKFGPGARLTANQKATYPEVSRYGGTIRGNNAASAGLPAGTVIGPSDVQVDTWNGAIVSD